MRSLRYVKPGLLEWHDVPSPLLQGDGEAIVEPVVASRCAIDRLIVSGQTPLPTGFAIGHEAVGRVVEIGPGISRVSIGDHVVISPYVVCGTCDRCKKGHNSHCRNTPLGAAFGFPVGGEWGGLYDDLVRVPAADAMLTPIPDGADLTDFAAAGDSLTLGREVIGQRLDEGRTRILVLGWSEHGLYQVAFAAALGATEIVYVDDNAEHRRIAENLGARSVAGPPSPTLGRFDLVVVANPDPAWFRDAFLLLDEEGVVDSLGGFVDLTVPHWLMYGLGATLRVFRGYSSPETVSDTIRAVIAGKVVPSIAYGQVIDWEDIPVAMVEPDGKPVAVRKA